MPQGLPILSPEWGGSPIDQRRKPWEHRPHQQATAPDGATGFTSTSHSSARYGAIQPKCFHDPQGLRHWATLAVAPFGAFVASRFGGSGSYFDGAQHERRAGFGGGRKFFSELTPRHHPVIARSLRRSDLAGFWEVIGHTASREIATSLIAPRDDEEESRAIRWLHSYFDGAQHERRAGFGGDFSSALLRASARRLRDHLTFPSSVPSWLWPPLPADQCEATRTITSLGEGGG